MAMSKTQSLAFGIGAIGKDFMYAITASFVLYYYQNELGISATFVGIIMMVARLFDAFNDPLMGVLVAKTNTKWGRFRPWIFSGSIINAFVCFGLFAVPEGWQSGGQLMAWFAVAYILWGLTYTLMDVPFWSMVPATTDTPQERETLSVIGRTCAGIGGMVVSSFGLIIAQFLAGDGPLKQGFTLLALAVSIAFVVFEIICVLGVRERHAVVMETSTIGQMLKALLRNDQAVVIVLMILIVNASIYLNNNLLIYFFQYNIGVENWQANYSLFTLTGTIIQLITMSLIYPLCRKKFSNSFLWKSALVLWMFGLALVFFYNFAGLVDNFVLLLITTPCLYIPAGITTVQTTVFLSGSVDYGELKTGHRDESVIFSMQTFIVKAASALAIFVVGVGLDLIGVVTTSKIEQVGDDFVMIQAEEAAVNPDLLMTGTYQASGDVVMSNGMSLAEFTAQNPDQIAVITNTAGAPITIQQAAGTEMALAIIMTIIPIIGIFLGLVFFIKKFKLTDEVMEANAQKVLEMRTGRTEEYAKTGQIPQGLSIDLTENGMVPTQQEAAEIAAKNWEFIAAHTEQMRQKALDSIDPLDPNAQALRDEMMGNFASIDQILSKADEQLTLDDVLKIAEVRKAALATIDPNKKEDQKRKEIIMRDFDALITIKTTGQSLPDMSPATKREE